MDTNPKSNKTNNGPPMMALMYALAGAAISISCLIISSYIALLVMGGASSVSSFLTAHLGNRLLLFFDAAALVIGVLAGLIARRWEATARRKRELEVRVQDRTAGLEEANRRLELKIAQQKRIEAELESAQLETARLIGKLEKVNRHLSSAADQVEELTNQVELAHKAQSELLLNLEQELRPPLNEIIGMTQKASDAGSDQKRHDFLSSASRCAQDVLSLIDDLLSTPPDQLYGSGFSRSRNPLRILVADDNVISQIVISRLLKSDNHALVFGDDGKEVVELIEKQSFDLVLIGLHLPDMSGAEATGIIREREKFRGTYTPIIGLLSPDEKDEAQRLIDSGMDSYLIKPVDRRSLREVINKVQQKMSADRYGQSLEAATEARLLNRRKNQPV